MRVLLLFTLALALLAGAFYGFVVFVDPYGEFMSGRFPAVVMDSRREKVRLFKAFARQGLTDGLILGTSRSLLLRPSALAPALGPGSRVFNFAVENGHAEDFLAIYHYVRSQGADPRWIVVGLDIPSLHNDDVRDHMFDRSALKDHLDGSAEAPRAGLWKPVQDIGGIFTKDYCKDSFHSIWMGVRHQRPHTVFTSDGFERDGAGGELSAGSFTGDTAMPESISSFRARLAGMSALSPKRLEYLAELVHQARSRGSRVTIWLTPIHPKLQQAIVETTNYNALLGETFTFLRGVAASDGVDFEDFTRLQAFGGSETAWNDATHMDGRNMDRVARQLTGGVQHGL